MSQEAKRKESARLVSSILIDPFRQIKFGVYMLACSLTLVIVSVGFFVMAFREQYKHVMGIFSIVDPAIQWDMILNDVFYTNLIRLMGFFAIFMLMMLYVIIRLTHRYYGPLVSIERFIESVTGGDYSARVAIRSKDELQRLVKRLNRLASVLEQRHGSRQHDSADLERTRSGDGH